MTRWTPKKKAKLLRQIDRGEADPAEHGITPEELAAWRAGGLHATRARVTKPRHPQPPTARKECSR